MTTKENLISLLEPAIEALGFELTDVELNLGHGHGLVRLFIDADGGITVDDCALVSRQVSGLLDVEDPIPANYDLEVSSPGADRKLVKPEHFDRFAGSRVKIKLTRLIEGRRRINGQLLGREEQMVRVRVDETDVTVALADIDVARLAPDWNEYIRVGSA